MLTDFQAADMKRLRRRQEAVQEKRSEQLASLKTTSMVDELTTTAEFGKSYGLTDKEYEKPPVYLRAVMDKIPYGYVHMSLRIGPVLIENGAEA